MVPPNPKAELEARCRRLLTSLGIDNKDISAVPLTGGVASDIALVTLGERQLCAKFALAKLKVAEDWFAPIGRNRAEYDWLHFAGSILPDAVPKLYGWSEAENGFAMEYLGGDDTYLWKTAMMQGTADRSEAARVGDALGRLHAASTAPDFAADAFHNHDDFHALRLDPYLLFTAQKHPALSDTLNRLVEDLRHRSTVLIHGDVSPKNILIRGGSPVLLDAECATLGDPSFDTAFCLNHLILKALHLPASSPSLLATALAFWQSYAAHVSWEDAADVEARTCALLPALMLARVDGKSPVEYLTPKEQDKVRSLAPPLIATPVRTLAAFIDQISPATRK